MKKVALAFSGSFMGGAESVMLDVTKMLERNDYQIDILLNKRGEVSERVENLDFKPGIVTWVDARGFASWKSPFSLIINFTKTFIFMFRSKADVFLVEGKLLTQIFSPIGKIFGKQVVSYVHYPPSTYEIRRCFYGLADKLLFCAAALGKYFVEAGADNKNFSVVRNYVDSDRFKPSSSKSETKAGLKKDLFGLSEDNLVVCLVGHLSQIKGQAELLRAVKRTARKDLFVVFAGKDNDPERVNEKRLRSLTEQLELTSQVKFLGKVSDILQVYRASDVMALPSFKEGLPLCVLEAMACELPVLASRVDGTPEAVEDGESGFLVEAGDVDGLAARLSELSADSALRESFGQRGRALAIKDFSQARFEEEFLSFIGGQTASIST